MKGWLLVDIIGWLMLLFSKYIIQKMSAELATTLDYIGWGLLIFGTFWLIVDR